MGYLLVHGLIEGLSVGELDFAAREGDVGGIRSRVAAWELDGRDVSAK